MNGDLFPLNRIALSKNGSEVGTVNINFLSAVESGKHGGPGYRVGAARLRRRVRLAGLGAKVDPVVNNIPDSLVVTMQCVHAPHTGTVAVEN